MWGNTIDRAKLWSLDTWRLIVSVALACIIYVMYSLAPYGWVALAGSVALLHKFGSYKVVTEDMLNKLV